MTEAEAVSVLMKGRYSAQELDKLLHEEADTKLEVRQHLTSSYGKEGSHGGKLYEDPVLTAMIEQERRAAYRRHRIAKLRQNVLDAQRLLNSVHSNKLRILLIMYYYEGKQENEILRFFGWHSARTLKKRLRVALDVLMGML